MDMEKVIKALEERISTFSMIGDGFDVVLNWKLADDILSMLKDQQTIVHCRECKWYERCELNDLMLNHENGFCADGERRTDDA